MAEVIDTTALDTNNQTFGVITPQPWRLANQDKGDLDKIRDECMDKIKQWEDRTSTIFREYQIFFRFVACAKSDIKQKT